MTAPGRRKFLAPCAGLLFLLAAAQGANAQAWITAPGSGTVSFSYQLLKVRYHLLSGDMTAFGGKADGRWDVGDITGQSFFLNASYTPLRNLQLQSAVAYVGGSYSGPIPESTELDDGRFHGSLQDATFGASYMIPWAGFALTPGVAYSFPTRNYEHHGHVAPGRGLDALTALVSLGRGFDAWIPGAFAQLSFSHAFVEDVDPYGLDSDRYAIDLGYLITPVLGLRGYFSYYQVKDGLDWYSSDFTVPGAWHYHDAAAATLARRAGGSLSYQFDATKGVFLDIGATVSGTNTHDGLYYTIGTNWSFVGPSFGPR